MATIPSINHSPTPVSELSSQIILLNLHTSSALLKTIRRITINFTLGDLNMHSEAHIDALSKKHAALDEQIHNEESRPAPDSTILHELKKEKLVLKDEMMRLKTQ